MKKICFFLAAILFLSQTAYAFDGDCQRTDVSGDSLPPYSFKNGTPANANRVNKNFDCLYKELGNISTGITVDSSSDNVGIGKTTPESKLDVNGTIKASELEISGTVSASSFIGNGALNKNNCFDVRQISGSHYIPADSYAQVTQKTGFTASDFVIRYDYGNNFTLDAGSYYYEAPKTGMYFMQFSVNLQNDGGGGTATSNDYLGSSLYAIAGKINGETTSGVGGEGTISYKWESRGYRANNAWSGLVHLESGTKVTIRSFVYSHSRVTVSAFMGCLLFEMEPVTSVFP